MKTRARHTIVTYRRSNISTQFSRGHSLRTNLAPRQSRSIINATLEGVGDYPSLGHAVFALLEFPSRFDLSLSLSLLHPRPIPIQGSKRSKEQQSSRMKSNRYGFERCIYKPSRVSPSTIEEEIFFLRFPLSYKILETRK